MKTLLTLQLTIFLLVAVGFLIKKIHIIGPQGQKNINDLVIYLILPCNILHAFTQSAADGNFMKYLEILLISIGIQVFCVIYGKVMFRKEPEGRYKCLQYGTICSNLKMSRPTYLKILHQRALSHKLYLFLGRIH